MADAIADPITSPAPLTGGCLCGAVRYRAGGTPFNRTLCHCSICRRASGAPLVAWFSVKAADFEFTSGRPQTYRSSARAQRSFCPSCGTALTFRLDASDEVDVTTSTLDDPEAVAPQDHIFAANQLGWLQLGDALPRYAQERD